MIDYTLNLFAIIGWAFIVYYFIIPLTRCMLFALGFTLFTWWKWSIGKVLKHPLLAVKTSVKCFLEGVVMWTPYFNYERLD